MHLDQNIHLKQVCCDHGLPFTDHCNLEFKVFSWGEVISVSLQRNNSPLQTVIADLGFHSPFSYSGMQCLWSHSQGMCWTSDTILQWAASFFYQRQMLSCSLWEAASANVCAPCATTILGLVQVCELQSWQVLDCDQCAWILLLLFQFCSFSLTSSLLSLSLSGLSHLMMSEQGKSFHFFFVSITDHERALSLLLFWVELCITKATKLTVPVKPFAFLPLCPMSSDIPWDSDVQEGAWHDSMDSKKVCIPLPCSPPTTLSCHFFLLVPAVMTPTSAYWM